HGPGHLHRCDPVGGHAAAAVERHDARHFYRRREPDLVWLALRRLGRRYDGQHEVFAGLLPRLITELSFRKKVPFGVPFFCWGAKGVSELTILMPCLNEAATLAQCIAKARGFLERTGIDGEVLVADNGSLDGSRAVAERAGARVVEV